MNKVFISFLLISSFISHLCDAQVSNQETQNPLSYPSSLVLRNGGYTFLDISFSRFQVQGVIELYDDKIRFTPDTVFKSVARRKVFRYNHLMSPFSIFYSDFKQVKYGLYFADFLPIRVPTIITNDGTKYRFSVKKAKAFINEMKLKKSK